VDGAGAGAELRVAGIRIEAGQPQWRYRSTTASVPSSLRYCTAVSQVRVAASKMTFS
jgi:hypothetical protein